MKKSFSRHSVSGTVFILLAILFSSFAKSYSIQSQFEGKIVKKVDFVGIRKTKGKKIEYVDLENADQDDLYEVCVIEEDFPFKAEELREGIKAVFNEGKFADVQVEVKEYQDGVWVRFFCEERPLIANIEYKGLEEVQENVLNEAILVKRGEVLRTDLIERSTKIIKDKYIEQGLFNALVQYKITKEEGEENSVIVVFIVDEGEEIKIEKVSILGAKKIPDHKLIGIMKTEEKGFFVDGNFNRSDLEEDKRKIIAMYKKNGYLDAEIIEEKVEYQWTDPVEKQDRGIYITLKIKEGDIYYFDGYTITGNKIFKTSELEEVLELRKEPVNPADKISQMFTFNGDDDRVFDDELFQRDRQMINFRYANLGYIFTRVIPTRRVEERDKIIDGKKVRRKYVHFKLRIVEGKKAYVENIIIKGNKKTLDKVIRREVVIKEGELFSSYKMQISREKIFGLGFFKEVNIDIRPGSSDDKMNLIIDVEEQPTGSISLGGGYGTATGFSIFADIGQKNIYGTGRSVNVRFEYGPEQSSVRLGFTEPWLFDYPVKFHASVFYTLYTYDDDSSIFADTDEEAEYKKQSVGYTLSLTYRFWYYYGIGTSWSHSFRSVIAPSGNASDEILLEEALGIQEKRKLGVYVYRNSKDNSMNPTKGWEIYFGVGFIGGEYLRGDDHYLQYKPRFSLYYSPFHLPYLKKYPVVMELRASATFLNPPLNKDKVEDLQARSDNNWLEKEDRLTIGGTETVRGWPRNSNDAPTSWEIGMFHRVLYGAELRIPIDPQYIWFVTFFDAGSLWGDRFWEETLPDNDKEIIEQDRAAGKLRNISDFREAGMEYWIYSWGMGFKIQIPMMPLRFWWGKKMLWVGKDEGYFDEISGYNFQFAIGDMRF